MPEFFRPKHREMIKDAKERIREKIKDPQRKLERFLLEDEVLELAGRYNQKVVGHGSECVVVESQVDPDAVMAFNYRDLSPEQAKATFYIHRIFSTIFPHNFPHFYAASGKKRSWLFFKEGLTATRRQRLRGKSDYGDKAQIRFPKDAVEKVCQELGISIFLDPTEQNYVLGIDGGEYFVDTIKFKRQDIDRLDQSKMLQYMENHGYREEERELVRISIERLKALRPDGNYAK